MIYSSPMKQKKQKNIVEVKIDKFAKAMERGFAGVDKKFAAVAEDMENLRTELKADIKKVDDRLVSVEAELKTDIKKVDDRVISVESKLGAIDNRIDNESFARKDLEMRVRKVLPSLARSTERA